MPSRLMAVRCSPISFTREGFTPAMGSSSRIMRGSLISARADFEQLLLPAGKGVYRVIDDMQKLQPPGDGQSALGEPVFGVAHVRRPDQGGQKAVSGLLLPVEHQMLENREFRKAACKLERASETARTSASGRAWVISAPPKRTVPASAG